MWLGPCVHPLQVLAQLARARAVGAHLTRLSRRGAEKEGASDRHLIETSPTIKGFTKLEEQTGIEFKHIRLLVQVSALSLSLLLSLRVFNPLTSVSEQAFTHSSLTDDCDTLKLGCNQRLEFLGDAVLQYVVTAHLYTHYPDQNEGQLTVRTRTRTLHSHLLRARHA
jgi:hypothetical protein